ncbi:hypothetical protein LTR10_014674 [Elasticomyces elasticus]|uniref:Uncharacterized protein n=1 Tax=Exophiala sideris TaxID=1016849 RepID=A0ABR0J8P8_9EURO|nr:hypothetical protein LTR10_014674 [Elasticomyces elasticus]KAK5029319.1 hypothetical protein LTS07_005781 [Exophiala sideris]KAK5057949.1 hypothetical protein LTR69_006946 [Exophiala sideris]KAK5181908.1 hypothetical protein LTR44_005509 [Eurotiomycetes sp. CCFEE 6388]
MRFEEGRSLIVGINERMDWAAKRNTKRKEDETYSLLGIFDIHMPLIYGERERALLRLKEEIDKSLQGPGPSRYSGVNVPNTSVVAHHPVKKNYRKVHVTIFYWEADEVVDMVRP